MDIASPTATSATTPTGGQTAASSRRITSDFDTFLLMLTTQMQNQDPLNPIDSADYAVQLATFSGVEQQTRTNQTLDAMLARMDMQGLTEVAGWVGQEARSAAPVAFAGEPVPLILPGAPGNADRSALVVRDAAGRLVAREEIAATATAHDWQGRDATGAPLPPGLYAITVERMAGDQLLSDARAESYATVEEVRAGSGGPVVVLAGGAEVAAGSVTALRRGPGT